MLIKQKHVRNIRSKLAGIPPGTALVVTAAHTALPPGGANHATLGCLEPGELRLPRPQGTVTRYNAEGSYRVHRDQPKESRYITTLEWSWQQWKGRGDTETITEFRDVYRECYPRTFLAPPAVELYPVNLKGERIYVSPVLFHDEPKLALILHTVNLFLEIFGECEIRQDDLAPFLPIKTRRVNWELLPPGRHPWSERGSHIQAGMRKKGERYSAPIIHRQSAIQGYGPAEIAVGQGGFTSYLAYLFPNQDLVLLESTEHGNATYIFDGDWEEFSQLSKAEILSQGLQKNRLIHSKGWENRLAEVLGAQPPLLRPV